LVDILKKIVESKNIKTLLDNNNTIYMIANIFKNGSYNHEIKMELVSILRDYYGFDPINPSIIERVNNISEKLMRRMIFNEVLTGEECKRLNDDTKAIQDFMNEEDRRCLKGILVYLEDQEKNDVINSTGMVIIDIEASQAEIESAADVSW